MRVEVLLFASLSEFASRDRLELEVSESTTARELLDRVADQVPELSGRLASVRVAVDHHFRSDADLVLPGNEIALIPPVSGG